MPVELQVIRASEFIRLNADEVLDFEATTQALAGLAQACHTRGLNCALLDLRLIPIPSRPQFTTTELAALVGTFRAAGFSRRQRLAILYRHDIHGGIRSFAFISRIRGLQVQAFSDYETAIHWLADEPDHHAPTRGEGVQVPIKQSKQSRPQPKRIAVGATAERTVRGIVPKKAR
jgi:hypothetical protein